MTETHLRLGAVFLVEFPEHDPQGHEQQGPRPAILVGIPTNAGRPRFPTLMLTPVTTFRGQSWQAAAPDLYPVLPDGAGGLNARSVVLTDQTRALDIDRIKRFLGNLTPQEYAPIKQALKLTFGL